MPPQHLLGWMAVQSRDGQPGDRDAVWAAVFAPHWQGVWARLRLAPGECSLSTEGAELAPKGFWGHNRGRTDPLGWTPQLIPHPAAG